MRLSFPDQSAWNVAMKWQKSSNRVYLDAPIGPVLNFHLSFLCTIIGCLWFSTIKLIDWLKDSNWAKSGWTDGSWTRCDGTTFPWTFPLPSWPQSANPRTGNRPPPVYDLYLVPLPQPKVTGVTRARTRRCTGVISRSNNCGTRTSICRSGRRAWPWSTDSCWVGTGISDRNNLCTSHHQSSVTAPTNCWCLNWRERTTPRWNSSANPRGPTTNWELDRLACCRLKRAVVELFCDV